MIANNTPALKLNLKKTAGMLNKIERMINDNTYCADVAQQINAAIGLLKKMNEMILTDHISCCGPKKLNGSKLESEQFVQEIMKLTKMMG
jgi:DNA-binding FrmR family transcriptional regulator